MTDQPDPEIAASAYPALRKSGFPFQTAMVHVGRSTKPWVVEEEEMPWRDVSGREGFLDFVVKTSLVVATVECKRTEDETLTFLVPKRLDLVERRETRRVRCVNLRRVADATPRPGFSVFGAEWHCGPETLESSFCVLSKNPRDRLLERDVQPLLRATDAYALRAMRRPHLLTNPVPRLTDTPVLAILVTNAKIFVAEYDPTAVSIETGTFDRHTDAGIVPAEVVRFRKAFLAHPDRDLGTRTVFVVRATAFARLLEQLHTDDRGVEVDDRQYAFDDLHGA